MTQHLPAFAFVALFFTGCAAVPRPLQLAQLPPKISTGDCTLPVAAELGLPSEDQTALDQLVDETKKVLASEGFRTNMVETGTFLGELWLAPRGQTIPSEALTATYLGFDPAHPMVDSVVRWGDTGGATVRGLTGIAKDGLLGTTTLDDITRRRWESALIVPRSCAINTLAHEMTHLLALHPGVDGHPFVTDAGVRIARFFNGPLASYVVGAVAQCTYLQQKKMLAGTLEACVREMGINNFAPSICP